MGHLYYGNSAEPFEIPDRVLAHLKVVVSTKLRRAESFTLSWRHGADTAPGRTTLWLQPSIPLRFQFAGAEPEALNPAHLKDLVTQANSSSGLTVDLDAQIPDAVAPARRPLAPVGRAGVAA